MKSDGRPDQWSVECIGSFAFVSLWVVPEAIGAGSITTGRWCGSIQGNDAVIVARELHDLGLAARCCLLSPTNADVRFLVSELGSESIVAVGARPGEYTHSLCIEGPDGLRSWVFSRVLEPQGELFDVTADVIYADFYPEFVDFLNRRMRHRENCPRVVANLSMITSLADLPQLEIRPAVLQASVPRNVTLKEAANLALHLLELTRAERAFVTMGANGALLAIGKETWHSKPQRRLSGAILGCGAIFSSRVILGLAKGLDQEALLSYSVKQTCQRLRTWSSADDHRP